jgi:hypothetical protein
MNDGYEIEKEVLERAMAFYPAITQIVEFSTPVVSFGYPKGSKVATLGINPSSNEFQIGNGNKNPLSKGSKRLVDTELLGIEKPLSLTDSQARKVIQGCYSYFMNKPYEWFDDLQTYVLTPTGNSYGQGTACHLDLVQWATDPVWQDKKMPKTTRSLLLESDKEFLRFQLTNYKFDYVFLNGSTVIEQVEKLGIVELRKVDEVRFNKNGNNSRVVQGSVGHTQYIGWGLNVGYGATYKPGLEDLSQWLSKNIGKIS